MKIYLAQYCPCVYEGAWATLSPHRTIEGAEQAIKQHKAQIKKEWEETYLTDMSVEQAIEGVGNWDEFVAWNIEEMEVLD